MIVRQAFFISGTAYRKVRRLGPAGPGFLLRRARFRKHSALSKDTGTDRDEKEPHVPMDVRLFGL